jgi:hypothetical protein
VEHYSLGKRDRYRDHVDPEHQRWGRTYRSFPGVDECVRLILAGKARGAWADIIAAELAEHASEHLDEMIDAFRAHVSDMVALYMLMALEIAALPTSVEFLAEVLKSDDPQFVPYATRALLAIDSPASRAVLYQATRGKETS